jgi:hypothetical protein
MNRRTLSITSLAAAALTAAITIYLSASSDSDVDAAAVRSAADAAQGDRQSIVRKDNSAPERKGNTPQKIDPLDYTTAPKPGTMEAKLVGTFADRQLSDEEKVERLLGMIPQLLENRKSTAMDYATQLIKDEDYVRLRPRLLRLADTDELREVVMLDMLTRDDGIKMLSLVELLKTPSKTTKADAREILEAFLEKDYGDDPNKWDAPVRQWIAENQDI